MGVLKRSMNPTSANIIDHLAALEARVHYLEEMNRRILDSLDMVASLGYFQNSLGEADDIRAILSSTWANLRRLMTFNSMGYLLVDEKDCDFVFTLCDPDSEQQFLTEYVITPLLSFSNINMVSLTMRKDIRKSVVAEPDCKL